MDIVLEIVMAFFAILGGGVCIYSLFYIIAVCVLDCDIELAFYEKFGKSPRTLKDKVVIITGASSGIGEHLAKAFAKHAVKLVLTARRKDELGRVKNECLDLSKGQLQVDDILVVPMDVTDHSQHAPLFKKVLDHFGRVDVLVNNAGRSQRALFDHIEMDVDRQMFDLNVFSVVNLSRVAVNYFNGVEHDGQIAVVSSLAGIFGVPYSSTYTASKHAIHGYFNALRTEKLGSLGNKKLHVTLLCPGPTYTNFLSESFTEKSGQKYGISAQPTDRRMTGERCGELCAIAIANQTNESWISQPPSLPMAYGAVYFPICTKLILKFVGPKKLFKVRDSKEVNLSEVQVQAV